MDALYFRVSSERQTTENQFDELLQVAEKDGSGRDWSRIREALARVVIEEPRPGTNGAARAVYRVDAQVAADLARECVYVEQGRSGKIGARQRPLFEQMKRDAAGRKFDRLLVWKVSRLGRDMREVIAAVYELADLGIAVVPVKSQTGPISSTWASCYGRFRRGTPRWRTPSGRRPSRLVSAGHVRRASTWAGHGRCAAVTKSASCARQAGVGPRSPRSWGSAHGRRGGFTRLCRRPPGPGESMEANSHAESRSQSISRSRGPRGESGRF